MLGFDILTEYNIGINNIDDNIHISFQVLLN